MESGGVGATWTRTSVTWWVHWVGTTVRQPLSIVDCRWGVRMSDQREELEALYAEREELESQMEALGGTLTYEGGPGLKGGLVDEEGFPRADLDIVTIRRTRHTLACMKTDYAELSRRIEERVFALLAPTQATASSGAVSEAVSDAGVSSEAVSDATVSNGEAGVVAGGVGGEAAPFALVDQVSEGSPAEKAGLQVGDRVVDFGGIGMWNYGGGLGPLGALVANSEGVGLSVVVEREGGVRVGVELTPERWAGRGLLGCHLVPL